MASSNRHWPSMFKSKPTCNSHHHQQWQHDLTAPSSLISSSCHRPPFSSGGGCEERNPEPKPRWNPKPEQIRILEAIFNSGMVNPPRDEIRKIRAQLQEYGQVGDANVFYWFQNRKSRSKHKLRHLQNSSKQQEKQVSAPIATSIITLTGPSASSSSSSSDKSSPNKRAAAGVEHSPTGSVNQTYFQSHSEFVPEPFYFPIQPSSSTGGSSSANFTQGFCFSELSSVVATHGGGGGHDHQDHVVGPCTSLLLSEMMNSKKELLGSKIMQPQVSYSATAASSGHAIGLALPFTSSTTDSTNTVPTVPSSLGQNHGVGESSPVDQSTGAARSTVFINDVAFDVSMGPFNVRESFGDDVALVHSSGQPVLINEWGVTVHSLQHGASYYLLPLSMAETYMRWGS